MENKVLGALSLCKKAGALQVGITPVKEALLKNKAYFLLFASDVGPNTRKKALNSKPPHVPVGELPLTQRQIAALTYKPTGVLAVTHKDLAALCQNAMANATGGLYKEEPI